ncbi:MAG: PhzF family phenazine biosynthesis protein [Chlorobi bacterium]|nr:PhzF family phenazine biosynthesis protein [Chlorobiota bacterium]MCI0715749.1 PhzF family phenazine biosynthesis protein [Chlorobiota bacterium]
MKLPICTVDAFTDMPFSGNPAAVCILQEVIEESLMQKIAFEMNLSETAFVLKQDDGYSLRWFTPAAEVDLCGHATLASAHIMWQKGICKTDSSINIHTKSGLLTAEYYNGEIGLNFPAIDQKQIDYPPELIDAIGGAKPKYVGMTKWNYLIELEDENAVRSVVPRYDIMLALPGWGTIITAKASMDGYDFVSRFFAPEKGVPEDPVTGIAHCALGPYWQKKLGKDKFKALQASQRGGTVGVSVVGERVLLTGHAVSVLEGEINI